MTHFGILCPPTPGHLNPMTTLGNELQKRGHRVTLFGLPDAQAKTLAAGLDFWVVGESKFPLGKIPQLLAQMANLKGFALMRYANSLLEQQAAVLLCDAPEAIAKAGVEALVVDQVTFEGGTIAAFLEIPFISVCNALMVNQEDGVPPFFTHWKYSPAWWAYIRNQVGSYAFNRTLQPILQIVNEYRQKWKLPLYSHLNDTYSQIAQLGQQPAEFEFPRQRLPQVFHFTGPLRNSASKEPVYFPFEKLTEQPLIYASLGTMQNYRMEIFNCIAAACEGLDVQLVMALGHAISPEWLQGLPGNPVVVEYAPQLELLKKATLTITHAGLNTVLDSLSNAVPMIAIPITSEQPGIAARLAWTGAGEVIPLAKLSVSRLQAAIQQVLTLDSYKNNASRLQEAIRLAGGVSRAADIVETAISTGKPVFSNVN